MAEENISLGALKSAIKEKGAKWLPAITSLSRISPEKRRVKLGLKPSNVELQLVAKFGLDKPFTGEKLNKKSETLGAAGLPSKFDWRDDNGIDWTTPIKPQGNCGSCVAFGTLASLEALLKIRTYKAHNKNVNLSEAHLFFCNNRQCNPDDPNSGWNINPACDYIKNNGVPDDNCYPYVDHNQPCNTCQNWQSKIDSTKIKSSSNTRNVNQMKNNIVNNGPQITGMAVYEDFWDYSQGVYEHVKGDLEGYHCVSVVGYDDENNCWICKNSWGTGWGENGWFRIKYGECGIEDVFGMWNMVVPEEPVEPKKPICFIATAAFGSKLDPNVQFLREFRDEMVLRSMFKGPFEWLLNIYYKFSPPIARKMEEISPLKKLVKYSIVYPFVYCTKGAAFLVLAIRKFKRS